MFLCNIESKSKCGSKVTDTFKKGFQKRCPKKGNNLYYAKGSSSWSECKKESHLATTLQGSYKKPLAGELRQKREETRKEALRLAASFNYSQEEM